jgi:hypothetical protein
MAEVSRWPATPLRKRMVQFAAREMPAIMPKDFGLRYAFTSHQLSPASEIPRDFDPIRDRAANSLRRSPHARSRR